MYTALYQPLYSVYYTCTCRSQYLGIEYQRRPLCCVSMLNESARIQCAPPALNVLLLDSVTPSIDRIHHVWSSPLFWNLKFPSVNWQQKRCLYLKVRWLIKSASLSMFSSVYTKWKYSCSEQAHNKDTIHVRVASVLSLVLVVTRRSWIQHSVQCLIPSWVISPPAQVAWQQHGRVTHKTATIHAHSTVLNASRQTRCTFNTCVCVHMCQRRSQRWDL